MTSIPVKGHATISDACMMGQVRGYYCGTTTFCNPDTPVHQWRLKRDIFLCLADIWQDASCPNLGDHVFVFGNSVGLQPC